LSRQKNYAGAINEFQNALAKTPNDASIINNLALAKQQLVIQQLNLKMATQTSGALGQLLGDAPPDTGSFGDQLSHSPVLDQKASPLSLVDLGSDAGVVDLGSATGISVDPDSLKGQLDRVLANHTLPTTPPDPRAEMPQVQDIELLFQPPQSTASQFPGPQRPTNSPKLVNPMMDAEERAQVEAIFAQLGGLDDTLEKQALDPKAKPASDALLKDAVKDTSSDQNTAPGSFGSKVAKPNLTPTSVPAEGTDINARDQLSGAAATARANDDVATAIATPCAQRATDESAYSDLKQRVQTDQQIIRNFGLEQRANEIQAWADLGEQARKSYQQKAHGILMDLALDSIVSALKAGVLSAPHFLKN